MEYIEKSNTCCQGSQLYNGTGDHAGTLELPVIFAKCSFKKLANLFGLLSLKCTRRSAHMLWLMCRKNLGGCCVFLDLTGATEHVWDPWIFRYDTSVYPKFLHVCSFLVINSLSEPNTILPLYVFPWCILAGLSPTCLRPIPSPRLWGRPDVPEGSQEFLTVTVNGGLFALWGPL